MLKEDNTLSLNKYLATAKEDVNALKKTPAKRFLSKEDNTTNLNKYLATAKEDVNALKKTPMERFLDLAAAEGESEEARAEMQRFRCSRDWDALCTVFLTDYVDWILNLPVPDTDAGSDSGSDADPR